MIDFDEMINRHLSREQKPKQEGRYYPSEIGTCLRKIWYTYKYPQEVKADLLKIFEIGNMMHDFVADVLKSEKNPDVELLKSEMPLKFEIDDLVISGRVDDLLLIKADGKNILVEVKSAKTIRFQDSPSRHHVMQLQLYMHATNVHTGIILYLDKTTLESKVFTVHYNEKMVNDILNRFKILHKLIKCNELPKAEAKADTETSWMCRFCEYRNKCDRNEG
jgi:CRISPR/Cas system-associated exonuclease Cas4 (RecB family)